MGYRRPFGWGIAFEGSAFPLCLQGKRLVAKTPRCDVSRHRKLVNLRGAGFLGLVLGLVVAGWVEGEVS